MITVCVADGTVYSVVAVVALGADCPRTLYVVGIFLLSYIPPSIKTVGVGSVVIVAHEAVLPSVVKYFPEFPVWQVVRQLLTKQDQMLELNQP
jgi:hypothetical protein